MAGPTAKNWYIWDSDSLRGHAEMPSASGTAKREGDMKEGQPGEGRGGQARPGGTTKARNTFNPGAVTYTRKLLMMVTDHTSFLGH